MIEGIATYLGSTFLASPTASSFKAYLTYYAYICIASILIPSKSVKGHSHPKRGPQLTYSINGFRLTILTVVLVLLFGGVFPRFDHLTIFEVSSLAT